MNPAIKLFLMIATFLTGGSFFTEAATSITRHGITWEFDKNYTTGQYANGDPWVVGPVVITQITPTPTAGRNGTVINPELGRTQGFDDRIPSNNPYSESLNVGNNLPLTVAANSSVVSSISSDGSVQYVTVSTYVVLTVVSAAPASGSFRPPYIGVGSRASAFNASQLDYTKLQKLAPPSGTPDLTTVANYFEKVWYEQDLTWTGRELHTSYMAPSGYGRDMANRTGDAALLLNLNYTNAQKEALLIRLVQYGIDIYGILLNGGKWNADGGHNNGRVMPLLTAAAALNNSTLKAQLDGSTMRFQEFQQTFFVTQADVNIKDRIPTNGRAQDNYSASDIGMPEWGVRHDEEPRKDNNRWDSPYRDSGNTSKTATAMVARVLGLRSTVNWEPLFQYQERHLNYEQSAGYGGEFNSNPTPNFHKQFYNTHKNAVPGSSGPAANPPPAAFSPGDRIQVSNVTNVRGSGALTATLLGVQAAGSNGTIVGGPVGPDSNNVTWWQVNFDTGVDGWTGQENYIKVSSSQPVRPTGLRAE
jgi:hypothetical protein